jgi:hypothetical protein
MTMAPGQFRLHRQADPALDAGRYRVRVTTTTLAGTAAQDEHVVEVGGPRLRLDPAEVAATSPPDQAVGGFTDQLPYVALVRRTLPWERAGPQAAGGMWLALLVTRESPAPEAALAQGPLGDAVTLPGVPPGTAVSLLRVNGTGLAAVRAQLAALPARCHVREVSLADTATTGPDDDGWQAVVVGTRLPLAAEQPGVTWRATLVSVEGRTDLPLGANLAAVSLVALHSWTFTSLAGGPTFQRLLGERITLGRYHGAVRLAAVDRAGGQSEVAYRPPLAPTAPQGRDAPADDDVSARSAFELGRLLAAADGRLLRDLVAWRRARQWSATATVTDEALAATLRVAAPAPEAEPAPTPALEVGPPAERAPTPARRAARAAQAVLALLDERLPAADLFDVRGRRGGRCWTPPPSSPAGPR